MSDVIQFEIKVMRVDKPNARLIFKPLIVFSSHAPRSSELKTVHIRRNTLCAKPECSRCKNKAVAKGFRLRPLFYNPWGCDDECIYIRTGEKATMIEVHGYLIRYIMIKGNRN